MSSGATAASTAAGELALGFYADSGFSNRLTGDAAYTVRTNVSPTGDMALLAQDRVLTDTATTANPVTRTGANTPWLAATLVLKTAAPAAPATALARSAAVGATPVRADATPVAADKLVYAFTAVAPAGAPLDATSLLFCPLNFLTVGRS